MLIALLLGLVIVIILGASQFAEAPVVPVPTSPEVTVAEVREQISNLVPGAPTTTAGSGAPEPSVVLDYDWGPLTAIRIGATLVQASVADTPAERIAGLSNTPLLPPGVVKLFVFDTDGPQSIWMKDMRYSIDILWLDQSGLVVHTVSDVSPDTYPNSFASPVPARYVIEARSGFVVEQGIVVGTPVSLPGRPTN
jgi:uncharacterized membrane protein (UPF0127 family)